MKPSLSAPTLTDFAAVLATAFNQSAGLPEPVQIKCAINRGKLMVLAQHSSAAALPARQAFAHLEHQIGHQFATIGLPDPIRDSGAGSHDSAHPAPHPTPLSVQVYLKRSDQSNPYAVHRFLWHRRVDGLSRASEHPIPIPAEDGDAIVGAGDTAGDAAGDAAGDVIVTESTRDETLAQDAILLPADVDTAGDSPLTHPDSQDYRQPVPIPTLESTVTYPADDGAIVLEGQVLDGQVLDGQPIAIEGDEAESPLLPTDSEAEAVGELGDELEDESEAGPELVTLSESGVDVEMDAGIDAASEVVAERGAESEPTEVVDAVDLGDADAPDFADSSAPDSPAPDSSALASGETANRPVLGRATEALPKKHADDDDVPEEKSLRLALKIKA